MRLDKLDIGFSVLLLMASIWIMAQALGYGVLGPDITGPGFFPLLAGLLLAISTASTLAGQLRRRRPLEATVPFAEFVPVAGIILLTIALLSLVERIGIVVLMPVYIAGVSYLIERPGSARAHAAVWLTAIAFTAAAWYLFGHVLRVPLPYGLFQQAY